MTLNPGSKMPEYLFREYQMVATISFTAFWALLSLMLTVPYSQNAWFALDLTDNFKYTVLFYMVSLMAVCLSRRMMFVAFHSSERGLNMAQYTFWVLLEIFLICAFYSIFTTEATHAGLIEYNLTRSTSEIFQATIGYGIMGIGIPTIIADMYFTIGDQENTIRVLNYGDVVSDREVPEGEGEKIALFDNNGTLRLSVSSSNLYYIESDDNYVHVWYCDSEGELKQYMLRCKLKTIEESFKGTDLIRINRKYIVNMQKVTLLKHDKDGFEVNLDREEIKPLPITKTYEAAVLARFNERSN